MLLTARWRGTRTRPDVPRAPISTLDLSISSGEQIPIEERAAEEVTHFAGKKISPNVSVAHPAFDVTPARLITAIITERGIARPPFGESLDTLVDSGREEMRKAADADR